jgi:hypothetical protein
MTNECTIALKQRWKAEAEKHLLGRKIIGVRWMTDSQREELGWYSAAVLFMLDDGTLLWPSADDEGNDAGALFGVSQSGEEITLPVIG